MYNLSSWEKLERLNTPIQIAIAGGGSFGKGIVNQTARMKNMQVCAIADLSIEQARSCFLQAGYPAERISAAETVSQAIRLLEMGQKVIVQDGLMLPSLPVDVLCDVTGDAPFGAQFASNGIDTHKHVVVVNIESDVGVGAILRRKADREGVVYTEADGDQPSLIKALFDFCKCLGMEVDVAGKWTHMQPYDPTRRLRESIIDEEYIDGTKNQIEMCCVANMTGLIPDIRGMHTPSCTLEEVLPVLDTRENGGILGRNGIVEAINCLSPDGKTVVEPNLGGGVFVIARGEGEAFREVARGKGVIHSHNGERVLLYRPYHLIGVETPMTILRAALYGEPTASPLPTPCADVVAVAKRDLRPGDQLTGNGSDTVRGVMITREESLAGGCLPMVLAHDVFVSRPIRAGQIIRYSDLLQPGSDFIWKLRQEQDALLG